MQCTMKKILYSSFAVLFAVAFHTSCNKEISVVDNTNEDLVEVTIIAENPNSEADTKTELSGGTPYWSKGDAIGVTNGTSTNYKFTTGISSPATTASFTGSTSVSTNMYAYYPYSTLNVSGSGAKVEMPYNQFPTASSFDGAADLMFSKKFSITPAGTTVTGLEFARAGAILKVVFVDGTATSKITGQHPSLVSLTTTGNLVGRVYLDVVNQTIGDLYGNQSKTVNAVYTPSNWYSINGTNGAYIIVYPQTLAEGSSLNVSATTELYTISKNITIPAGGIKLEPGKITTLNISIADANVSDDAALTLPFEDDFDWLDGSAVNGTTITDASTPALSALYTTGGLIFTTENANELRLGNANDPGYIITKGINLSAASHITVSAKRYGAGDGGKIVVSIDGGDPIEAVNDAGALGADYKDYIFNIPASTTKSKVTIATSTKRGYINNVEIVTGAYDVPTEMALPYDNSLISGHTGFTFDIVAAGGLDNVWTDTGDGVQANAYGASAATEAYLVSPVIDLTGKAAAVLSFDHRVSYFGTIDNAKSMTGLQIKVGAGDWTDLTIPYYPANVGNDFMNTPVSLDAYVGNKIQLRFKFISTTEVKGRWNIKNLLVRIGTHGVALSSSTATMGGTTGATAVVTATSEYPVNYSVTSGSGFSVTQVGSVFTFTATADGGDSEATKGTVQIKESDDASYYSNATIKQSAKPSGTTITKTMTQIFTAEHDPVWTTGTQYANLTLDGVISVSCPASGNNGKFYETSSGSGQYEWRLYKNNSGAITITASGVHTISSVTIIYAATNENYLKDSSNNTVESGSAQTVTGSTVTYTVEKPTTNGQVKVRSVSVTYN